MNNENCEFNENQGYEDLTSYEELKDKFLLLLSQTINSNKSYFLKKQIMVNLYILILVVSFVFAWFVFKFFTAPSSGLTFNRHGAGNGEAWLSPTCCWEAASLS